MGSLNRVLLIGNLGRDAEMRFTSGGTPVSTVSLATTERFTTRDGKKQEDTQWHRLVIWGKTAEALQQYLTKGKQIYAEGKLQTREWEAKDGTKQKTTEIRVDKIVLLGGGRDRGADAPAEAHDERQPAAAPPVDAPGDDDIPFAWFVPLLAPIVSASLVLHAVLA